MKLVSVQLLRITGVCLFIGAVTLTILFAQGYLYDPGLQEIVKKSVLRFEVLPKDAEVLLDNGEANMTASGEIRALPGKYRVTIQKPGFSSWTKDVVLKEDEIIRFPEIILFPDSHPSVFLRFLEPLQDFQWLSADEDGVTLMHPFLHFEKHIPFEDPEKIRITEQKASLLSLAVAHNENVLRSQAPLLFLSRIGKSFHFLFLTPAGVLQVCDEDMENCRILDTLQIVKNSSSPNIASSPSREIFYYVNSGRQLMRLDFARSSDLPTILKNLVSGAF